MSSFDFNKQKATLLYRKWYVESKKSLKAIYDKDQVDNLSDFLLSELHELIEHYKNQKLKAYRAEIPMLYIRENKIETFPNEILVIDNSIQSLNMPGCMAVGSNIDETFENYFKAVIECADARYKSGLGFMNIIHTMQMYDMNSKDLKRIDVINELTNAGWSNKYEYYYNTILLRSGNKVTYTVPNTESITGSMIFWFRKLQFQISAKMEREMYTEINDNTYWTCDICGGDETTGCLYFDPTECPRNN
jgi:hypothetical protein